MKYNTVKPKLIIPEYGRNIQALIEHAVSIENATERQAFTEKILDLMQEMHPQTRNVEDYRAKLWAHLLRISGYRLEVELPENVSGEPIEKKRPNPVPYPDGKVRFRHYGRNVQEMIAKAIDMDDDEKQGEFISLIGAYMKMSYKTWNQPSVSDVSILNDLRELSGGELEFDDDITLDNIYTYRKKNTRNGNGSSSHSNSSRSKNGRGRNGKGKNQKNFKSSNSRNSNRRRR